MKVILCLCLCATFMFPARAQVGADTSSGVGADPADAWVLLLQALEGKPPLPPAATPPGGNFYTVQRGDTWPPLPGNPLELPFWDLGAGYYVLDDRKVDYAELQAQAELAALLADGFPLQSGGSQMMSSLAGGFAYANPVYLTNLVASSTGAAPATASFSIAGGTNNVPYDILTTTNVADPLSQWNWLGIGYTSNRYTFSNQPLDYAFYILAKPQKTMVVGWGNDGYEQCTVPFGLSNALAVAGGLAHSLGLLDDGTVVGWGNNVFGQISIPTNVLGATMIAAGWFHSVALLTNGHVVAWGLNGGLIYDLTAVPPDLTNATVIAAQAYHSLALRSNGTVVIWGHSLGGDTNVPAGLSNVVAIAAGGDHNLAAKSDGTVVAWGYNASGQTNVPAGLSNVVDVAAGFAHSVALRGDGTVVAWGDNRYGQTNVPAGLSNVVAIAAGGFASTNNGFTNFSYSLALRSDNTVAAWGGGGVVMPLGGMSNLIAIAGGANHALAVRTGPRTPVITLEPTNQYQIAGGNVTFRARGAGLYGVTYQWQTNGGNWTGATNTTLSLTNVQATQAGVAYTVSVSNEVGLIVSSNATLSLVTPPVIISQTSPTNQVAIAGENLTLSVVATAPGQFNGFPLSYQWKFNGTNIDRATNSSFTVLRDTTTTGTYSVIVTNAVGSATTNWQVTITYVGSYVDVGTFAYHLATNAVGRTNGFTGGYADTVELTGWTNATYSATNMALLTNSVWSTNFWLKGMQGLSATCIGFSNRYSGQGVVTMVSPRHCLFSEHMHVGQDHFVAAFLDTNNAIYWRSNVETVFIGNDTSVGILDSNLPSSVAYLPVVPTNLLNYLPTNSTSVVQGIGMNQNMRRFSQPMTFTFDSVTWNSTNAIPLGVSTNWSVALGGGDSSAPECLLIGNQLVLVSHNFGANIGPNYASQFDAINEQMVYLSTKYNGTNYQLTPFPLTNWPSIH